MITSICTTLDSVQTCLYDGTFLNVVIFVLIGFLFITVVKFFMIFTKSLF